jgi:hypothetical protein
VQSEATSELEQRKPTIKFTGKLSETRSFRYGYDVKYGDLLQVNYGGFVFNCHLRAVGIRLSPDGSETLDLMLRNYD